ncbi:MAG: radical SAM protein, partial [Nitrososphaerota archaeon]
IRIDTNGHGELLNKDRDVVEELKAAGINKISVSLNAQDRETYNRVCRPKFDNAFESVLEFVEKAKGKFRVEITAVAIPEVSIPEISEIAERIGVKLRIREYIPCFL